MDSGKIEFSTLHSSGSEQDLENGWVGGVKNTLSRKAIKTHNRNNQLSLLRGMLP